MMMTVKISFKDEAHKELIESLYRNMGQWLDELSYIDSYSIEKG